MPRAGGQMPDTRERTRGANKRGAARLGAVQALYQMEVGGTTLGETVAEYENHRLGREVDGEQYAQADSGWFRSLVSGVLKSQAKIDPMIHKALPPDWPLARVDTLLRAILRVASYELSERKDVPARVVVNEYVDIAHAFFDGDEQGLVNGVLDRIARQVRPDEMPARSGTRIPQGEGGS